MGEVSQSFAQCNYDTTLEEYENIPIQCGYNNNGETDSDVVKRLQMEM